MKTVIRLNSRELGRQLFRTGFADSARAVWIKGYAIVVTDEKTPGLGMYTPYVFGFDTDHKEYVHKLPKPSVRRLITSLQTSGWWTILLYTERLDLEGGLLAIGDQNASITVQNASSLVKSKRQPQHKHVN